MADDFYNYDPTRLIGTWGGYTFKGVAKGTFVKASFDEDAVKTTNGAQGAVTATITANRTGKVVVTLAQGSPTNDDLSRNVPQPGSPLITKSMKWRDLNGTTQIEGEIAYILKCADSEFGDEQGNREWTFVIAKMKMNTGGAVK